MKFINRIADRALERLASSTKAAAADPCWWAKCSEGCYKRCCPGSGCTSICVCV